MALTTDDMSEWLNPRVVIVAIGAVFSAGTIYNQVQQSKIETETRYKALVLQIEALKSECEHKDQAANRSLLLDQKITDLLQRMDRTERKIDALR